MKTKTKNLRVVLAVLEANGRVMIERRAAKGLLAGMWAFPEVGERDTRPDMRMDAARSRESILAVIVERGLVATVCPEALSRVEHRFTHL